MDGGKLNNVILTKQASDVTITIASGTTFTTSGGHNLTLTTTGATDVTLPTTGTLLASGGDLGTPSGGVLTNGTGLPISTGVSGLGSNVATFLATPSSANLASAVTGETGSGALVFATSPTLVTPALGTPGSGNLSNCTLPSTRYAKGNISGAVTVDFDNGNHQICTTTATVTGITISDLPTETGMILDINNSGGYAVTFGATEIIASTDTGRYACAFYNDNGTIYFMGKGEVQN